MKPSDPSAANRKPYLDAWLKRTGRELSVSGRLSELVLILSEKTGGDPDQWRGRLQRIMSREEEPGFELLTEIDSILARPSKKSPAAGDDCDLFD